jgi:hypothetical protein
VGRSVQESWLGFYLSATRVNSMDWKCYVSRRGLVGKLFAQSKCVLVRMGW